MPNTDATNPVTTTLATTTAPTTNVDTKTPVRTGSLRTFIRWFVISVVLLWSLAALILVAARWIDPPTTAVHVQRRLQAWIHHTPYRDRYEFIPLRQISPELQHAVIAAEDSNFYQHHGFDWHQMQIAAEDDLEGDRTRGASTITQQLVKNLFFGTGRSVLRKGAEATLVPVAELVLGKTAYSWRVIPQRGRMGDLVFMEQSRRLATTTQPQPGISAGNRRHGSLQFCRLP